MFTMNSLNLAQIISKDLDAKGLSLKVKPDSPLNNILQYVYTPHESLESYDLSKAIINNTISIEEEGKVGYDFAMDETVKDLAPKLSHFVKVMKTVINPFIVSLGNRVVEELAKITDKDLYNISVTEVDFPDILTNNEFINLVSKRKDNEENDNLLPLRPLFPELSPNEVRQYLLNFPGFSRDLAVFLENSDIDYRVYNGVFRHEYSKTGNIAYIFNGHPDALYNSIISFVLGIAFAADVVEGCTGTLNEYYNGLDTIIGQAALGITKYINKLERGAQAKTLVMGKSGNSVKVNPLVYRSWMENGGDVEVLYGMMLSKNIYQSIDDINEKKESFLTAWQKARLDNQLESSSKYVTVAKNTFISEFERLLDEEVNSNVSFIGNDPDKAKETFRGLVEHITSEDTKEIYTLARKLVCRSRYPNLHVELFLESIDEVANKQEGIAINDAALLAMIKYVSVVIANGIEVSRL